MSLNGEQLTLVALTLGEVLQAEADKQNAYFERHPDGRISLELTWIDPTEIVEAALLVARNDGSSEAA